MRSLKQLSPVFDRGAKWATWYSHANREIRQVATKEGWEPNRFAATIAITSPRSKLLNNIQRAIRYCGQGISPPGFSSIRAALARYEASGKITGPKVSAFYRALCGDGEAIAIDVWVSRALLLPKDTPSNAERREGSILITDLGLRKGVNPSSTQAALWAGAFLEWGLQPSFAPIMLQYRNWLAADKCWPKLGSIPQYIYRDSVQSRFSFGG